MALKRTTVSTSNFEEFADKDWRGNWPHKEPAVGQEPPVKDVADEEMPRLDPNDVWLYEKAIVACIRRNVPDTMNQRVLAMIKVLGARARIAHRLEHESGIYIGRDD